MVYSGGLSDTYKRHIAEHAGSFKPILLSSFVHTFDETKHIQVLLMCPIGELVMAAVYRVFFIRVIGVIITLIDDIIIIHVLTKAPGEFIIGVIALLE